jgi:hypothetical protein
LGHRGGVGGTSPHPEWERAIRRLDLVLDGNTYVQIEGTDTEIELTGRVELELLEPVRNVQ